MTDTDLLRPWTDALGDDDPTVQVGRTVVARYEEPHRRYHDRRHLAELLHALELLSPDARPTSTVVCAAYWHDAVYDPRASDNEERSAGLAQAALAELGRPAEMGEEVARLVLLTARHEPSPDDRDGVLLSDADLSVLAAAPARYLAYCADVRAEYGHLPDDAFRDGRRAVLRALLDRPSVYVGARGRELWERAARRNLAAELSRLETGAGGADRRP